jgi:putative spermidine/putrescine transport system ATP-binding protein
LVRLRGISKTYDGVSKVVRDLDFDVRRGEFLTLLGPSGSGKTTTLMMLAGFEAPTRGEIFFGGRSMAHLPPHKRAIGVVFQNYALFPHMNVGENIAFPLNVRKVTKADSDRRVQAALDMVRLSGFAARKPMELSGGQQQRVALARALVFEPELVLMDEPLGALDRQLREQMQLEIRSLHEKLGITVVYVTHDQNEAMAMSDRIAVFSNGVIDQIGTPEELYETPANGFVARFIGENNVLEGKLIAIKGEYCEAELPGNGQFLVRRGDADEKSSDLILTIRPECVSLAGSRRQAGQTNLANAVLIELIYFGDHRRALVQLDGGQIIAAKVSPTAGAMPAIGEATTVSWDAEQCFAFMTETDRAGRLTMGAPHY